MKCPKCGYEIEAQQNRAAKSRWANMTKAERAAEMSRIRNKGVKNQKRTARRSYAQAMRPPINNPTSAPDVTDSPAGVAGGSHQRMVSCQPTKNLVAFCEGLKDYEKDMANGTMTDCPYGAHMDAARDWWSGYHYREAANE